MPCQEFIEAGPSDHALTITPRQPLAPDSHHLIGEPAQASTVAANAVVGEVAPRIIEDRWRCWSPMDRCRFFRHQSLTAATARANRLFAARHLPNHVLAIPRPSPDMGQAEEVEGGPIRLRMARDL